jgi:hypothetical protein
MWEEPSAERIHGGDRPSRIFLPSIMVYLLPDVRLACMMRAIRSRYPFIRRLIFMIPDSPLRILIGY